MPNRITKKLVTFRKPFALTSHDEVWPAGDYTIETEEAPLEGLTFVAYRRIETIMVVRPATGKKGVAQFITIDPLELDAALLDDRNGADHVDVEDAMGRAANEGDASPMKPPIKQPDANAASGSRSGKLYQIHKSRVLERRNRRLRRHH
ncbi:MAG: hypothetical protein GVY06_02275 [Alphaproteobacteria bacterium]|jgi:hypothetical protein|nr:hypothetical protein [Alphaproteobacteria bacterium]